MVRGDTALFPLGRKPMPVVAFIESVTDLQTYLANDTVDCNGHPSRLQWLDRCRQPKVPLDIAVSGPRMIEFAGRIAQRVTLAGGARPDRGAGADGVAPQTAGDARPGPDESSVGADGTAGRP